MAWTKGSCSRCPKHSKPSTTPSDKQLRNLPPWHRDRGRLAAEHQMADLRLNEQRRPACPGSLIIPLIIQEVVPALVEREAAVPHLSPAVWEVSGDPPRAPQGRGPPWASSTRR